MIISTTEFGNARRCPWLWVWSSFNGQALTPVRTPTALDLGRMIHEAHARWEMNPTASLTLIYQDLIMEATSQIRKRWVNAYEAPIPDDVLNSLQTEVFDLGRSMCTNYETFYGSPTPENYQVIQPEQSIIIDIPNTEHDQEFNHKINGWLSCPHQAHDSCTERCEPDVNFHDDVHIAECNGMHQLECTFDSLIQNTDSGVVFIRERKTWDKHPVQRELEANDQFGKYCWALSQPSMMEMLRQLSITSNPHIGGIAYDGMWKRAYVPKGRRFDELFLRMMINFGEQRLINEAHYMAQSALAIASSPYSYPSPHWAGCWDDKTFQEMCIARRNNEDTSSYLADFTTREPEWREDLWPKPEPVRVAA